MTVTRVIELPKITNLLNYCLLSKNENDTSRGWYMGRVI